jgi:hypothetical protein
VLVATLVVAITALPAAADHTLGTFAPDNVPVGCEVTITGTGFTAVTLVEIDGISAVFTTDTATQISAVVPSGATGPAPIVVEEGATDSVTLNGFDAVATACPVSVTNFTPSSGLPGSSVVITGTGFAAGATVKFNQTSATSVVVNSPTQITATVPTGATTGPIRVTVSGQTARSATSFTVTPVPAPTITSFKPLFGPVGKKVTITGTNFSGTGWTTTSVKFNNVTATSFVVNSATQITATVPTGATTGKITVTTPGGTATSAANFTVSTLHARTATLSLKKHLVAKGKVTAADAFAACVSSVPVKIQRKAGGGWKNVKSTTTSASGSYKVKMKDVAGKYRAKAPKVVLSAGVDVCSGTKSPTRTNK